MKINIGKILASPITWYIGGAVLIIIILKRWNILPETKSRSEKQAEAALQKRIKEIEESGTIWNRDFWKNFPAKQYPEKQANLFAKYLKESFGFFDDDESAIFGNFRQMKYQTNVSQIVDAYARLYERDLHSDLRDGLSKKEMEEVYKIISQKPL